MVKKLEPDRKAILRQYKIPPPEGEILGLRYIAEWGDWYVQLQDGWYHWGGHKTGWKHCAFGPRY